MSPGSGVLLLRLHVVVVSAGISFTYSGFLSLAKDVTLGVTGEGWEGFLRLNITSNVTCARIGRCVSISRSVCTHQWLSFAYEVLILGCNWKTLCLV